MRKVTLLSTVFILCMLQLSCGTNFKLNRIAGNGNIIKKEFPVSDYTAIEVNGSKKIVYEQNESTPALVIIEIDSNLIEYVSPKVENGKLKIHTDNRISINPTQFLVYTNSKELKYVNISGSGSLTAQSEVKSDHLNLSVSGSGKVSFDNLEANSTECSVSGSGNIKLAGKSNTSKYSVSGSGGINASEMEQEDVIAGVSGSGRMHVKATNKLDASVSGSGSIEYQGAPPILEISKSGSGRIVQVNNN